MDELEAIKNRGKETEQADQEKAISEAAPKYSVLMDHIRDNHPLNPENNKKFSVCDPLGLMPVFKCMKQKPKPLA